MFEQKRYELAMLEVKAVLAVDPKHQGARLLEGEILYDTARLEEAGDVLSKLIDEFPANDKVRRRLAYTRKGQGRYKEAAKLFASLPFSPDEILPMAECRFADGEYRKAANLTCKLLASDPWRQSAYLLLAKIEAKRDKRATWSKTWGDSYRAIEKIRQADAQGLALESQGRMPEATLQFGRNLYRNGRWFDAMLRIEKALQMNPNLAPAHLTLGRIMMDTGRSRRAVAAIGKALSIQPGKQNWQQRLREAQTMAKADNGKPKTSLEIAQQHAADGEHDQARACALFAAQRNPQNVAARRLVGEYFNRPGDAFIRLWAWRVAGKSGANPAEFQENIRRESEALAVDLGAQEP